MATFALTDARVELNSVDISDHVTSVTLESSAEELDDTAMGDSWHSRIKGLFDWTVNLEFNQDFAVSGGLDATTYALFMSSTNPTIKIRPTSSAISTSNPEYSGTILVSQWTPVGNAVGELATVSVAWPGAGAMTRATA